MPNFISLKQTTYHSINGASFCSSSEKRTSLCTTNFSNLSPYAKPPPHVEFILSLILFLCTRLTSTPVFLFFLSISMCLSYIKYPPSPPTFPRCHSPQPRLYTFPLHNYPNSLHWTLSHNILFTFQSLGNVENKWYIYRKFTSHLHITKLNAQLSSWTCLTFDLLTWTI